LADKLTKRELRAEIARLEALEAKLLREAEAAYYGTTSAELAAEAWDTRLEAERLEALL